MTDLVPVRRALISVSDKTGLADFARALSEEFGVELISTGGTAQFLRDQRLEPVEAARITGFPEMMDGRVKTLHPNIHGGLLALRDNASHVEDLRRHGIPPIDLACVNLYPFERTIEKPGATLAEAIENIDIGGPSMIRSAGKNYRFVVVVTSSDDYAKVLGDLRKHGGATCVKHRLALAQRAFARTARYDACIAEYLASAQAPADAPEPAGAPAVTAPVEASMPEAMTLDLVKKQQLRYGENPHQSAALYVDRPRAGPGGTAPTRSASVALATQRHGKELSYINLLDADAALSAVGEFAEPAACIVKHATPCGLAAADDLPTAFARAFAGDPLAAFGGIVALNAPVDLPTARAIVAVDKLLEVIVAPSFDADALELLRGRWKNVRLLEVGALGAGAVGAGGIHVHKIVGGWLVQQRDSAGFDRANCRVVSRRSPTDAEWADLRVAWLACKHVKSNAIVIAHGEMMLGSGAGQQDRVNACRIAIAKARSCVAGQLPGASAASDAFFPFPDGPALLLEAGVTAIIHPGGSVKDADSIAAADAAGAAMVLTGLRCFKH